MITLGWCKQMKAQTNKSLDESRKIFKVLTGKDAYDPTIFEEKKSPEEMKPAEQPKKPTNVRVVEPKKPKFFSVHDRRVLDTLKSETEEKIRNPDRPPVLVKDHTIPVTGSIYHSLKSRGLSAPLKKELRENGVLWHAAADVSDDIVAETETKLDTLVSTGETTAERSSLDSIKKLEIIRVGDNFCINYNDFDLVNGVGINGGLINGEASRLSPVPVLSDSPQRSLGQQHVSSRKPNRRFGAKIPLTQKEAIENKENNKMQPEAEKNPSSLKIFIPMIKKESKGI